MVCQFLLYNKVNQLYIYIRPHISSLLRLPPSHPPYVLTLFDVQIVPDLSRESPLKQ